MLRLVLVNYLRIFQYGIVPSVLKGAAFPLFYNAGRVRLPKSAHFMELSETAMDDFNYPILLFLAHFVVTRQTHPSAKEVRTDICAVPCDVGIRATTAISIRRHKSV